MADKPSRRMRKSLPGWRRLTTVTRWPVGIVLTSWRYMWRTTPIRRSEAEGSTAEDGPPRLPPAADGDELQLGPSGAGPMFHRSFLIKVAGAKLSPEELMRRIQADPNVVAPREFTHFGRVSGDPERMRPGDEFIVRMPGPWDGPVRVLEADARSFRLATLHGHLEAGQIIFSAWEQDERLLFRIETWARSGDRISNLLYDRLRFAKEVQFHMWTSFLDKTGRLSGGRRDGPLETQTRRLSERATEAISERQSEELEAIDVA